MAARKRWRRYIPDDEISVRAFLHLIGRLFYYVGLHSEYFLLNFGRGARAAVLALWHGVCWMLALGANILRPFFALYGRICAPPGGRCAAGCATSAR